MLDYRSVGKIISYHWLLVIHFFDSMWPRICDRRCNDGVSEYEGHSMRPRSILKHFSQKIPGSKLLVLLVQKKKKGNRFGKQHRRYLCHTYKQMPVQTKHVRKGLYEQARPLNALPSWNTSSPLLHICAWRCWPLKFQGTSNGSVPDLANVANLFWICLVINYSHWTGRHVVLLSFFGSKNNTGTDPK